MFDLEPQHRPPVDFRIRAENGDRRWRLRQGEREDKDGWTGIKNIFFKKIKNYKNQLDNDTCLCKNNLTFLSDHQSFKTNTIKNPQT